VICRRRHLTRALSVITTEHREVIAQLVIQFSISIAKAYELALRKKEVAVIQLEAWSFREAKPNNPAGWMIQAIENNYDVPFSYRDRKAAQTRKQKLDATRDAINDCGLCDKSGFRYIKNQQYPNGAMRQCTHGPNIEDKTSPGALRGTERDANSVDEV